jgi:hypothetical protein
MNCLCKGILGVVGTNATRSMDGCVFILSAQVAAADWSSYRLRMGLQN